MINLKADCIAERSFDDNIDSMFRKNKAVIVAAFLFIFFYIAFALGYFPSTVYSRFSVALVSILVVTLAFLSACGTTFYWDQAITPLTAEVVPIILLAVGLDSLFIIADAERKVLPTLKNCELRIAYALKDVGPSILTATLCESLTFFIGAITAVPALNNFCVVAGLAFIFNFILSMTILVPLLSLDNHRLKVGRTDIICCFRKEKNI